MKYQIWYVVVRRIEASQDKRCFKMSKAAQITFKDFRVRFATEDACRDYLFQERFPEGFVCPKCGSREYYYLKSRRSCQCRHCRRQRGWPDSLKFPTRAHGIFLCGFAAPCTTVTRITCWKELSRWMKRIWALQNAERSVAGVPSARKWRLLCQRTKKSARYLCGSK